MNPNIIFVAQIAANLLIFSLIARWYIQPQLARLPLVAALSPLLLAHSLRTLGLVFLIPASLGATLPEPFATSAAIGDLLTAILAFVSLIALRAGWRGARVLVWLFSIVGLLDLADAFVQGPAQNLTGGYVLGPIWFIPTVVVPALLVTHMLVLWLLVTNGHEISPALRKTSGGQPV